jgi:hypothetical protein
MLEKGNTVFYVEYQSTLYGRGVLDHIDSAVYA